jgi:hypothetical protein
MLRVGAAYAFVVICGRWKRDSKCAYIQFHHGWTSAAKTPEILAQNRVNSYIPAIG